MHWSICFGKLSTLHCNAQRGVTICITHTIRLHPVPISRVLCVKGTVNIFRVHNGSLCLYMPLTNLNLWTLSRGPGRSPPQIISVYLQDISILWSFGNWRISTHYCTWIIKTGIQYSVLAFVRRRANHISLNGWLGGMVQWDVLNDRWEYSWFKGEVKTWRTGLQWGVSNGRWTCSWFKGGRWDATGQRAGQNMAG